MIKDKKPSVVEFNCRFGDPEAQPLLYRMNSDIFDLFYKTSTKQLSNYVLEWKNCYSVTVVLASLGYPDKTSNGLISKRVWRCFRTLESAISSGFCLCPSSAVAPQISISPSPFPESIAIENCFCFGSELDQHPPI